jgi:hypothetical protein
MSYASPAWDCALAGACRITEVDKEIPMRKAMTLAGACALAAALVSVSPTPSRSEYWGHCILDSGSGFECWWGCEASEWCCYWNWDCM